MLVTCPDCKKQISSLVTACPNCGYPGPFAAAKEEEAPPVVAQQVQDAQEQEKTPPSLAVKKTGIARKIGVIAVLALVIVGVVTFMAGQVSPQRSYLGVSVLLESSDSSKPTGAIIYSVEKDSPAAQAGLELDDVIVSVNGKEIKSGSELPPAIANIRPGNSARLQIWRKGETREIEVKVGIAVASATPETHVSPPTVSPPPKTHTATVATKGSEKEAGAGLPKTATNSIGMEFVLIPAGSFMMGVTEDSQGYYAEEGPRHRVTISQPFYLGKYEVTQQQWAALMDKDFSKFKGRDNPVHFVSWDAAQEFIQRLNQKEGTDKYRLPTEAEWEYAARAGTSSLYWFGNDDKNFGEYEWYEGNCGGQIHPVGQKRPNAWGLYDMQGNVSEWVQDWFQKDYYAHSPQQDPKGPASGECVIKSGACRVMRGGRCDLDGTRLSIRSHNQPDKGAQFDGFRLAFSLNGAQVARSASLDEIIDKTAKNANEIVTKCRNHPGIREECEKLGL
jgi:formylglycine-generating enzyme required for sulfatase activity